MVEGQLKVLVAGRKIQEAARYAKGGQDNKASAIAREAKLLLAIAKRKRIPVGPEYFEDSVDALSDTTNQNAGVNHDLQQVRLALAEYRSALEPPPAIDFSLPQIPLEPGVTVTPDMLGKRAAYRWIGSVALRPNVTILSEGAVLNASQNTAGVSFFTPPSKSVAYNRNKVEGFIMVAGTQVLDGIMWKNVVFENTHIIYEGGDVHLENVRFVNCTFEAPATKPGAQFAEFAALAKPDLVV